MHFTQYQLVSVSPFRFCLFVSSLLFLHFLLPHLPDDPLDEEVVVGEDSLPHRVEDHVPALDQPSLDLGVLPQSPAPLELHQGFLEVAHAVESLGLGYPGLGAVRVDRQGLLRVLHGLLWSLQPAAECKEWR